MLGARDDAHLALADVECDFCGAEVFWRSVRIVRGDVQCAACALAAIVARLARAALA
jgi:hypothetical protein